MTRYMIEGPVKRATNNEALKIFLPISPDAALKLKFELQAGVLGGVGMNSKA